MEKPKGKPNRFISIQTLYLIVLLMIAVFCFVQINRSSKPGHSLDINIQADFYNSETGNIYYQFINAGVPVEIGVASDSLDLELALYDEQGNQVEHDYLAGIDHNPWISYTPEEDQLIRIEVWLGATLEDAVAGEYQLFIRDIVPPSCNRQDINDYPPLYQTQEEMALSQTEEYQDIRLPQGWRMIEPGRSTYAHQITLQEPSIIIVRYNGFYYGNGITICHGGRLIEHTVEDSDRDMMYLTYPAMDQGEYAIIVTNSSPGLRESAINASVTTQPLTLIEVGETLRFEYGTYIAVDLEAGQYEFHSSYDSEQVTYLGGFNQNNDYSLFMPMLHPAAVSYHNNSLVQEITVTEPQTYYFYTFTRMSKGGSVSVIRTQ